MTIEKFYAIMTFDDDSSVTALPRDTYIEAVRDIEKCEESISSFKHGVVEKRLVSKS